MSDKKIFVGRRDEIEQFKKVLERPRGEAVVVVGQAGMGKTWLVNKIAEIAENHPDLKCGWVRYEVTPTDSVDSTMTLMMDNAFDAAQVKEGSFAGTERRLEQWRSFLNVFKLGDLVLSLRRDPQRNTREQFLERLELISKRMPGNGRAVFIVDPEKYMQRESDQAWVLVVRDLPQKIKFIFAQRPGDSLTTNELFMLSKNVVRIPEEGLGILDDIEIQDAIHLRGMELKLPPEKLWGSIRKYGGHPYAIGAALDLLEAGTGLEELPKKGEPIEFAKVQWRKVCNKGEDAVSLFEAYAALEVGVPDDVAEAVSGLKPAKRKAIAADKSLAGLLREEGYGRRIYHAILADYILGQIGEKEKKEYHGRAAEVYREKLRKAKKEQIKPDALAAERLAEHFLVAEGEEAFVEAIVNKCIEPLLTLGLLDVAMSLLERAIGMVKEGSEEQAILLGNLGLVYGQKGYLKKSEEMHLKALDNYVLMGSQEGIAAAYCNLGNVLYSIGDIDRAEQRHVKSLEITEKLGLLEGMANQYGNLGLIYQTRGELDKAEQMHRRALEIDEKLGRLEGMASNYGNLGLIYQTRGELDKAEQMLRRSLEIAERLGLDEVMANQYANLGTIFRMRGDLDKAEKMYLKSLEIDNNVGRIEGIANRFVNLGMVYRMWGDSKRAGEYWGRARELYWQMGMRNMTQIVDRYLLESSEDEG